MAGPYTVDASVFLNAFNPHEVGHADSRLFLSYLREQALAIVVPTLLLPEVAGAIARGRRDAPLAAKFISALKRLPRLVLVPLDEGLADRAASLAARHQLRGSDAVYAAVALQFGSTLVTLDREQRNRVIKAVSAKLPAEAIE